MSDNTGQAQAEEIEHYVFVHARLEPSVAKLLETWRLDNARSRSNAVNYILTEWLTAEDQQAKERSATIATATEAAWKRRHGQEKRA